MSLYRVNDSDSPPSPQRDQDELAMFELSSAKEKEAIDVNYADSDDDSEVIVIDTTPAILAEQISADCDAGAQESPTKRRRTEGNEGVENSKPGNNNFVSEKTNNDRETKPYYNSVFEGCNSSEPIEIDDESEDESVNCSFDSENGKSTEGMLEKSQTDSPNNDGCRVSLKSSQTETDFASRKRKPSDSVLDQREENEIQKTTNNFGNVQVHTSETKVGSLGKADSPASTHSVTDTVASDENHDKSDKSVGDDEDVIVSQPAFEVIDLADDDDDDDDDDESITIVNEARSPIDERDLQTTKPEIEIIDVDELEDVDCEVRLRGEYPRSGGLDSNAKGTSNRIPSKPRFKPQRGKNAKIGQKEWKTVRIFRSILRDEKEEGHRKATHNCGNHGYIPPSNRCSTGILPSSTENRFIFHPSNRKPEEHHTNTFLGMNIEDAHKEQERLLQKAAQRVRNQPAFHVTKEPVRSDKMARAITFSSVVRDVHQKYPGHFKYRDFYARLGLPRNSNESMVKSQYRRLARVYHPDRNIGKDDTKHKFQAVTEAYNHLMNT